MASLTIVREAQGLGLNDKDHVPLGRHVGLDGWLWALNLGHVPAMTVLELRLKLLHGWGQRVPRVSEEGEFVVHALDDPARGKSCMYARR